MSKWHGWALFDPSLDKRCEAVHVGPLPGRKQIALYTEGETEGKILAYFQDEAKAELFLSWLDKIVIADLFPTRLSSRKEVHGAKGAEA